jgi:putative PIG3 family NAD(P)H quinone oxidoreductase
MMFVVYAMTIPEPGGPDALVWAQVPDPVPRPDQVLIDIVASAVNRADLLQRAGFYAPPPGAPPYPGLECSGRVAAVGAAVSRWRVGDEVCALLPGGGYAQRAAVHAGHCLPVPPGVDLIDAATIPEVACTVWSNIIEIGRLQSLDTILVHGGGSGIGTFAIQLAAVHGARVLTTARADKHPALLDLGAEVAIDYANEDFVAAVRMATHGAGANVILDIMGAAYLARNVEALATGGRLVVIGLQGGRTAELDLGKLLQKRASVTATALRPRPDDEKSALVAAVEQHVWPLIGSGLIRTVVHVRLPMSEAAAAHRIVEASSHIGKVALVNE